MAKEQTDKSRYPSRFGGGYITEAQYLAETFCAHVSRQKLPHKFWELKEWQQKFRRHIKDANELLKKYKLSLILSVLQERKNSYLKWLKYPPFLKQLDIMVKKIEKNAQSFQKLSPEYEDAILTQNEVEQSPQKISTSKTLIELLN
jgi:hypothetical protein